ncbi:MAG: helix-turn-helix domain-containing protein [Spirochaetaceae bacterium]|jgi:transcriptional regulator with XRE-family HTH domain|nr:helix-turn-helix domain-containing protein [Spirochaetaceae bacterium]
MSLEKLVIDNIKRIRKEKRMTQEKLAEACNTATSYIGLMEIYRHTPKISTIEKIARALGVDPIVFFQSAPPPGPEHEAEISRLKDPILSAMEEALDRILRSAPSPGSSGPPKAKDGDAPAAPSDFTDQSCF